MLGKMTWIAEKGNSFRIERIMNLKQIKVEML